MFDFTRTLLEHYTNNPPQCEDAWYGPWTTILTTLFPSSQGYVVTPQRHLQGDQQIPDFTIEVARMSPSFLTLRIVLIVEIENSHHWESGKEALMEQIKLQTDGAFASTAVEKVYWIETIGPYWRYGEKTDDGQDPRPMVPWHNVTHDITSYRDFVQLTALVEQL